MKKSKKIHIFFLCVACCFVLYLSFGESFIASASGPYSISHLSSLITDWGKTTSSSADVNADGKVNTRDLGIMMSNWTNNVSSQPANGTQITDAQDFVLNDSGYIITFGPGQKKYFRFTLPAGMTYFRASIALYDQAPIANMLVEKGEAIDYYDEVYGYYSANSKWGYEYFTTIGNTQIWAEMNNSPSGQDFVVLSPPAGTYYMIIKNMDTSRSSRINYGVSGY